MFYVVKPLKNDFFSWHFQRTRSFEKARRKMHQTYMRMHSVMPLTAGVSAHTRVKITHAWRRKPGVWKAYLHAHTTYSTTISSFSTAAVVALIVMIYLKFDLVHSHLLLSFAISDIRSIYFVAHTFQISTPCVITGQAVEDQQYLMLRKFVCIILVV